MLKIECEYDKEKKGADCRITIEGYSDALAAEVASMLFSVRKAVNAQRPKMVSAGDQVIAEAFQLYLNLLGEGGKFYNDKKRIGKK